MAFPESFLEELAARNDIVDVVSGYVRLTRRSGVNQFGLCPFHSEKTPSFSVNAERQIYHCFGCGKGGGVINFIMEVENLSVRDAVKLSLSVEANHATGTDIMIFGPAVAERFRLDFKPTDDINEAIEAVRDGGRVIVRVSGRYENNKKIFTKTGHYMVMIAATKEEVCILDPSWTSKKYGKWEKEGLVRTEGTLVYTAPETLHNEGIQIHPRYYIFRRKKGNKI